MTDITLFQPFIKAVGRGEKLKRDLTYDESVQAMRMMMLGQATDAQMGAFLISQRVKGEAVDEINGFTHLIRDEFVRPLSPKVGDLLDLAVPYDGKSKTAQLVPAIAVLLAEAGVPVLLHGDSDVPTKSGVGPGSVFAALGIPNTLDCTAVERMIEQVGFGYVSAVHFVPEWHGLLPIRRQFGLRTLFNTIEKFFNPADAPNQISGFFHANYIERIRSSQTGTVRSWMVQGEEGSVEMASGRKTHIFATEARQDVVLEPAEVGLPERERVLLEPVVEEHAKLNMAVLSGTTGPVADQAIFTAATILTLLDIVPSISAGMMQVQKSIATGRASHRLATAQRSSVSYT
ncbi:MAG: anthranilate phosphoribosyltransferase [Chloroflexota bacterium]